MRSHTNTMISAQAVPSQTVRPQDSKTVRGFASLETERSRSFALAFCLLLSAFSLLSFTASAQFTGSGTSSDPYKITTAADLAQLATVVNAGTSPYADAGIHYLLVNDLDLSAYGAGFNGGKGWIPIGTYSPSRPFRGNFDGNGKTITNLYIDSPTQTEMGLFGRIQQGTIKNLGLENINVTGGSFTGGLVGDFTSGTMSNCYTTGAVSGNIQVGGVAGYVITGSEIFNCYTTCTVSGSSSVGGVAGSIESSSKVENCAALNPSVKGTLSVGRITGGAFSSSTLSNNIAFDGIINNAGNTTWSNKGLTARDGADITKEAINADGTLGNRFTAPVWTTQNGKLPGLFGNTVTMPPHLFILTFSGGDGTSTNPYIITTAQQLAGLATVVNEADIAYNAAHYQLGNDIDLSNYGATWNSGKGWIPIGWYDYPDEYGFMGVFDGNNKKITGLYINNYLHGGIGLFGSVYNGTVKNLGVENVNITGGNSWYIGGIAGSTYYSKIINCYTTGNISGKCYIGGIVGNAYSKSEITNCYSTCNISSNISGNYNIGGIAGCAWNESEITNCYSTGNISGDSQIGGIAGTCYNDVKIENCYSTGNISGTTNDVGGIAGAGYNVKIENCYTTGNISGNEKIGGITGEVEDNCTIENCHSTGNISGDYGIGGIAGYVGEDCQIENCYSTGNISGEEEVGGIVGWLKVDSQIENCYSTGDISGTGDYIGGIAGDVSDNSKIENSYSLGDISGDWIVGGIAGRLKNSLIENSYSLGNISGIGEIGGIAGRVHDNSTIENSYSTGDISGNTDIGGIAGNIYNNSKIENCAALNINIQGISDIGRIAGYADNSSTLSNNIAWDGIAGWGHIGADDLDGESISKESINADGTLGNRFTSPVWTTQNGKLPGLFGNTVTMPPHLQLPGMVYITTTTLPDGTVGTPYSATLTADGDTPITWTIETGNLPTGLTLNASTGAISGTPTAEGTFTFAVKAANNVGSDTAELEIVIGSVGIVETPLMASLRVFPNPTRGEIIVENGELKIENVEIFDVMGRKQKIIFNFQLSTFNLTDLPSGIYFLKITTETGVITKKVIKT